MTVSYSVFIRIAAPEKETSWLSWMKDKHLEDVKKGGAIKATLIRLDPKNTEEIIYEARYLFKNRPDFTRYLEESAPALRAEGLEKFPPEDGFSYSRSSGDIIQEA